MSAARMKRGSDGGTSIASASRSRVMPFSLLFSRIRFPIPFNSLSVFMWKYYTLPMWTVNTFLSLSVFFFRAYFFRLYKERTPFLFLHIF